MQPRSFRHVTKRGGVYQYQRRVPKAVIDRPEAHQLLFRGQPVYRKTLGTGVYAEALAKASVAEIEFDGLVAAATRSVPAVQSLPARPIRSLDAVGLAEASRKVRDQIVCDWRRDIVHAEVDATAAKYLDWRIAKTLAAQEANSDRSQAWGSQFSIQESARQINVDLGFGLEETSTGFGELIRAVSDGLVQAREDVQTMLKGKSLPDAPSSTLLNKFSAEVRPSSEAKKFSDVVREQVRVANFAPKTIQKALRAHRRFVEIVGDKPVDTITRQDVHAFLDAVAAQEVGQSVGASHPVSRATVQSYLTQISSPMAFAIGRGWRDGPNPAANIDLSHWVGATDPTLVPAKRRFEIAELNALFMHPWFSGCASPTLSYQPGEHLLSDMRYWAPVLALFTGARASELGGLKLTEIMLSSAPHILVQPNEYRRTKNGKARSVPLLDDLMALGFDRYVHRIAASKSDRLFPDWECPRERGAGVDDELSRWANSKWIRAFNRTVIPSVFERDAKATRSPVTFHSFRGACKKLLLDSGDRTKANAIIGHSQDELDRRYLGHYSADELHSEFHKARFRDLKLRGRLTT